MGFERSVSDGSIVGKLPAYELNWLNKISCKKCLSLTCMVFLILLLLDRVWPVIPPASDSLSTFSRIKQRPCMGDLLG